MQAVEPTVTKPKPRVRNRRAALRRIVVFALLAVAGFSGWRYWSERKERPRRTFDQAMASVQRGDLGGVDEAIAFLENEPGYAFHTRVLRGAVLVRRGRFSEAMLELKSVSLDGELRDPALYWGGRCLFQQGKIAEAESAFRLVLRENADHVDVHRRLAVIYHEMGAMDATLAELEHVIRLDPDDYRAYHLSGTVYHRDHRQLQEAIEAYRKALDRDPPQTERAKIVIDLAEALVESQQFEEADRVLPDAGGARALQLKAECSWNLGRKEIARKLLKQSLQRDPKLRAALVFQAKLHIGDRKPKEAVPFIEQVLKDDPHDYLARLLLVQAYQRMGDTPAAERESSRMKESERLCTRLQSLYRQAMKDAGNADVREQIAGVCEQLGRRRLASIWKHAAAIARSR
jgi:tetratricopeptide (TPR) repeat protein